MEELFQVRNWTMCLALFGTLVGCAPTGTPYSAPQLVKDVTDGGGSIPKGAPDKYAYVDPNHLIPDSLLEKALANYDANLAHLGNKNYLSVVDFSAHSSQGRFFIIDMATGGVTALHVAHGHYSDPSGTGYATHFSNVIDSGESSLGLYMTAETYYGDNGYSLRLDGLSSTNSNVRVRDVVIHGATYVYDVDQQPGRSLGCLAIPMGDRDQIVDILKGGSLIYAGLSQPSSI
jgi:hypothetical protein